MAYREVRQFIEIIRILGYPNAIGIDTFDTPNFSVMANLLQWLSNLYDPDIVVIPDLSSQPGRVDFVRTIVQQMAIRSGIRMNPRKLYGSDRLAVRELLKLAIPIYRGTSAQDSPDQSPQHGARPPPVQRIALLSASVPRHSVELYDELANELAIRDTRSKILSTMPPLDEVEKAVHEAVDSTGARLDTLTKEIDRLNNDEDALRSKIKQRKHEYERQSRRLMSVTRIKPAFMDEYEALEQELKELFTIHFQHYRNVDFLEHELQMADSRQEESREKAAKQIGKLKKKVNKTIIGNVQQSFKLAAEGLSGSLGGPDDMTVPAGGSLDSDEDF
jgi:clusterin-associated protein 1